MNNSNNSIEVGDEFDNLPSKRVVDAMSLLFSPEHRALINELNAIVPPEIKQINNIIKESLQPMAEFISCLNQAFGPYLERIKNWQSDNMVMVADLVDNGWYPTPYSFYSKYEGGDVDLFMSTEINKQWDRLVAKIIRAYPERAHILNVAFKLHRDGNYIAAIPLFYSQADGICCQCYKSFLFCKGDLESTLCEYNTDSMMEMFLLPFGLKNHHAAGISSAKSNRKSPNRNGILHGHRKHLNYGTEINSLKVFSLLSFIVMSTSLVKKT